MLTGVHYKKKKEIYNAQVEMVRRKYAHTSWWGFRFFAASLLHQLPPPHVKPPFSPTRYLDAEVNAGVSTLVKGKGW